MRSHAFLTAIPLLVVTATWMFAPAICSGIGYDGGTQNGGGNPCGATPCSAQLVPPGDFRGKSHDQWGLEYTQWAIATRLGGQALPDSLDGVRYLPWIIAGESADLTITQGTALLGTSFFLYGERYDNGTEDHPDDPIINQILEQSIIHTRFDGNVVLEGRASQFPERRFGVTVFPEPIPFAQPQPRGFGVNSVAAIFGVGITTIFDMLPLGQHTIRTEDSSSSGFTYNITVVPIPGDFNHDSSVDAADYVAWRKNDISGQLGYNDWRANFGRTAASGSALSSTASMAGAAVPEPSTVIVLGSLYIGCTACVRRRHTMLQQSSRQLPWSLPQNRWHNPCEFYCRLLYLSGIWNAKLHFKFPAFRRSDLNSARLRLCRSQCGDTTRL